MENFKQIIEVNAEQAAQEIDEQCRQALKGGPSAHYAIGEKDPKRTFWGNIKFEIFWKIKEIRVAIGEWIGGYWNIHEHCDY